jgi:hypothetical protein
MSPKQKFKEMVADIQHRPRKSSEARQLPGFFNRCNIAVPGLGFRPSFIPIVLVQRKIPELKAFPGRPAYRALHEI